MSKLAEKTFYVLVADDSEDDRRLLKHALRRTPRLIVTGEVADGLGAIAYLKGRADFHDREKHPFPHLLLLDLKMPLQDGFEVLEWLRTQSFRDLTVVVLTDSMRPEHIKRALDLGADLFQVKPRTNPDREIMVLALEQHLINKSSGDKHGITPPHLRVVPQASVGIY